MLVPYYSEKPGSELQGNAQSFYCTVLPHTRPVAQMGLFN